THALLWWLNDDANLPASTRKIISDNRNQILVSAASAWEITTKFRLGKLPTANTLIQDFAAYLQNERFETLSISLEHGVRAGLLPGPHRDPFDRMLIAQAQAENIAIISNEKVFDGYGVRRVW
ncbi:MAG TPA: type II toxin-antitoxin system VapC family toxin, partial [Terriglobales bacterium]|nr:type II toxin-antitoxin system VapC family toxin [Terriglobales bacterium]